MILELTIEEAKLTKMLLSEELETVNELIKKSSSPDKEELEGQAEIMKRIISKLQ